MIAFGGRRGPHRSGSRCRGRPIERREAGREGCLWPNAASQGRPPDGSGGESERSTQNGRAKTLCGGGGGGGGGNSELPQAGFPESGEVWFFSVYIRVRVHESAHVGIYAYWPCGVRWRVCVCGGAGAVRRGDKAESPKDVTRIRGFVLGGALGGETRREKLLYR